MFSRLRVSALGTYDWARQLIFRVFSRALLEQLEELKAQLQRAEEQTYFQEQTVTELSTNLESEVTENESLWNQVIYLTNELHREKTWRQQQNNLLRKERAKCYEEQSLRVQLGKELEETKRQLAHQKSQEELLEGKEKETRSDLETLRVSYHLIYQRYEAELKKEKQKNDTLQQQLEAEMKSGAERLSEYQEQIQRLRDEWDAVRQQLEQEIKVLQQDASEREKSLCRELEELKVQLHNQTSANFKEDVSQALCTETEQLMEELEDEVCKQEEESLAIAQTPELLEEAEEKAPEKKKKASFWKRTCHFLGLRKKKKEKREKESIGN